MAPKTDLAALGLEMFAWARDLFPITRSITGPGIRETLAYIRALLPDIVIHEVPSGTKAFDWIVPDEWTIRDAFIANEDGDRIVDLRQNNLHILGYSIPVDIWLDRNELDNYLYSLPDQPNAIPYQTSYYERRWGFCLTHNQRLSLPSGRYHVVIDSDLKPGMLNYGELIIPGQESKEVFLSTYVCHPSMANNELSGPVVVTALARWLMTLPCRRYTYRVIYIPETIGSIVYLSKHLLHLKEFVLAGFNVTCVGDERCYSYLPSRSGNTLADRVAFHVLGHISPDFEHYTYLDRGSDERQYCAPGVDLPIASLMRSKYGTYPEYHTSLDDLSLVTPIGLAGGFTALQRAIEVIERNVRLKVKHICEPHLGKRGLYPTLSSKEKGKTTKMMMDLLAYCDGTLSLLEIADLLRVPFWELAPIAEELLKGELLLEV